MDTLGEAIATLAASGVAGSLFFFTPLWAPTLVFLKLTPEQARHDDSRIPQFTLADGFVLVAFVASANSCVGLLRHEGSGAWLIALALCANSLVVLVWWQCQRFMQQRHVRDPGARLLVQILLYPASVVVVPEILIAAMILVSMLEVFEDNPANGFGEYVQHPLTIAAAAALVLSVAVVFLLRHLFARCVVRDSARPPDVGS